METIDSTILKKGYSVFKVTETGQYYAMSDKEVKRIHTTSDGKTYKDLDDGVEVKVCELVLQPDKKIVLLNEDEVTLRANLLIAVPVKLT